MYLSDRSALVCTSDGRRFAAQGSGWSAVLAALREQLAGATARGPLQVVLSAGLARPFVHQPVEGIDSMSEATQVAALQAPDATGLSSPCRVWMERFTPSQPCLAVAVENALLADLRLFATERGQRLQSVRPWWDAPLGEARHWSRAIPLIAFEDDDALLLIVEAAPLEVFCYAPRPDTKQRSAALGRIALGRGLLPSDVALANWVDAESVSNTRNPGVGTVIWRETGAV